MDAETLSFLLGGGQLNVPDRIARGLWPHPPLKFSDLLAHIVEALDTRDSFPSDGNPDSPVGLIEKQSSTDYVWRRLVEVGMLRMEILRTTYPSAEAAARAFLRWTLGLPDCGTLDSWKVE
jgi:hypothetical protein